MRLGKGTARRQGAMRNKYAPIREVAPWLPESRERLPLWEQCTCCWSPRQALSSSVGVEESMLASWALTALVVDSEA